MDQFVSISDLVKSTTSNSVTFTDGSTLFEYDNYYIATDTNGKEDARLTIRRDHHYYKYHDFTGFINTASTIQVCMPYGCAPIEEY